MRSTRRSLVWFALALVVVSIAAPTVAMADIMVFEPGGLVSSTNPGKQDIYDVSWRENWGNDPLASYLIAVPQPTADSSQTPIYSAEYVVRRVGRSGLLAPFAWSAASPWEYYRADTGPTTWNLLLDVPGLVGVPGPYLDTGGLGIPAEATRPYEGAFRVDTRMVSRRTYGAEVAWTFGLDVTPPLKVTGVAVRPGVGEPPVSGWLRQSRAHITWDDKVYDALSGTGYFAVYLDGKPFEPEGFLPFRMYDNAEHYWSDEVSFRTPRAITIENLPAGKHKLQIQAVDRATNEGPLSEPVNISVDPDLPSITLLWPLVNGQTVGAKPVFKAAVTDAGGVKSVKFYIDGVLKATDSVEPYEYPANLAEYAQGSSHILRVLAEDVVGRTSYVESSFVLDKTSPRISSVSGAPNPFFPKLRDGYKDNFNVKFTASEPATATLTIRSSSGKVVRKITKAVGAGSNSFTWNGKRTSGSVIGGTYTWRVSLTDVAGNVSTSPARKVTIKTYEIVRLGNDKVRIIER